MRKWVSILVMAAVLSLTFGSTAVFAAEKKSPQDAAPAQARQMRAMPRMAFNMISGKIEKIDSSDPANIKVEIKNDTDGAMKTVIITQSTNITKSTDASELKAGDTVRAMAKNINGKEVALGVMFGKLRPIPAYKPAAAGDMSAAQAQARAKK